MELWQKTKNDDVVKTTMDGDGQRMVTMVSNNYDDNNITKWSVSMNSTLMVCKKEENFFFFYFVFFKNSLIHFFNESCSLFLWSFVQRVDRDGNKEMIFEKMKKVKCLLIWSFFDKFTQGIRAIKKLKHKRRRRENNLDVDQCVDPWWVFNRRMSEIKSLGLQKFK